MRFAYSALGIFLASFIAPLSLSVAQESGTPPLPDFPAALRRDRPVEDIQQAIVYTMNELVTSDEELELARKTGSDMLIRGWFKWGGASNYSPYAPLVPKAHAMGALFGGGITCSALYHGENGLTEKQVLDMATRGAEGQLIDAWGEKNCRHGTLSNPAYREYLLSWCKQQIDAGADYLFMDEINAALQDDEGFDDYSIADFRRYLLDRYGRQGWTPTDNRWRQVFQIDLADRNVAPDGNMTSFHYRAYLKSRGLASNQQAGKNPLIADWSNFRSERDDRAWKQITDAIRAHAAAKSRRVLISGNGLARYVDLQVLGIWDQWLTVNNRVDFSENQIPRWASTVAGGWDMAGRRVPVVLFHDWGFGGFPWLKVPPEDRRLWIRIRGAEIYASGGFFAFPVHGPFGNDSRQDGTLPEIIRQSTFYHQHKDLYQGTELLGFEPLETTEPGLSLALWRRVSPPCLMLHAINRQIEGSKPKRRTSVAVRLPTDRVPKSVSIVSPDWSGEKPGEVRQSNGRVDIVFPELDAYAVAILPYDTLPEVKMASRQITPLLQWTRPMQNEFVVTRGGAVRNRSALPGIVQGNLHQGLRNPPTFTVNMPRGGCLQLQILGVAISGAKLQWQVDGRTEKTVDLPDRDGKNDTCAHEYNQTYELPIPPGRHRVTLDNVGNDWFSVGGYAFSGDLENP